MQYIVMSHLIFVYKFSHLINRVLSRAFHWALLMLNPDVPICTNGHVACTEKGKRQKHLVGTDANFEESRLDLVFVSFQATILLCNERRLQRC